MEYMLQSRYWSHGSGVIITSRDPIDSLEAKGEEAFVRRGGADNKGRLIRTFLNAVMKNRD
jgi:hypothetical protein